MALLALLLPGFSGCAIINRALIGVDRVGPERVQEQLNQNALSGPILSASSLEVLHYFGLTERFEEEPDETLAELHRAILAEPERPFLHALAEISYLRGKVLESRDHFLMSAVYAYFYLLGEDQLAPPNPYDRRFRWGCDLYNRSLRAAFVDLESDEIALQGGSRKLPIGSVDVVVDRSFFPSDDPSFRFVPADDYTVWGLSVRLRDSGLGAPLVAYRERPPKTDPMARFSVAMVHAPATLFLRVQGTLADLEKGIDATLELHSSFEPLKIDVAGKSVPLESDFSTALALGLAHSSVWEFNTRGFLRGDETADDARLAMVRPYRPGLVPVVFVHGTASNPANWAEMFNLLQAEPAIRERTQFWFFKYSSGSPILFSASQLRTALRDLVATLDPGGTDSALQRMVLIGHSQGGLLVKLMAVDSDMSWWDELVGTPIEEFGFSEKQEELVRTATDFDPVPQLRRVIYISTPHQGSFLADRRFARWIAKLVAMPSDLASLDTSLLRSGKRLPHSVEPRIPTSLDNMRAENPFLKRLGRAPIAPGITAHSIVAIGDADPSDPTDADDGVVKYTSAHLEDVESEVLIQAGHSCQSDPRTIAEVRRLLLLHLAGQP